MTLSEICREHGVQPEYWDIWGRRHETSEQALHAILTALGAEELGAGRPKPVLDPVAVLLVTDPAPAVPLRVPAGYETGSVSLALYWEDGWPERRELAVAALPPGDECRLPLPAPLRMGYHDLEILLRAPGREDVRASMRVVGTPERAWLPPRLARGEKLAGLAVCLWGLRSPRNWGGGDFTDLEALGRWAGSELGVAFLGLNPLHALHNREPYNISPYLPLSVYYRNDLYLDVERMPEFAVSKAARRLVESAEFQRQLGELRASELVVYEKVARLKRLVLRILFREFLREYRAGTARAKEFLRWRGAEGSLLDNFAVFLALDEVLHRRNRDLWIWPEWPEEYRDPQSHAVLEFGRRHWGRVLYHQWVQWQIDSQLGEVQRALREAGMPVGLYHDLALATDRCGADLWAYRGFYAAGCRVGSPPDDFAPEGQDWAFPPPLPDAHRGDAYRLFTASIRKNARHGGALRIDHVMRFARLFWIPDGLPAREGTYVHDHFSDVLRLLALESHRGQFLVVGEDLGTCPDWVREGLRSHGILSYRLFYFERNGEGAPKLPDEYEPQALVSSTTHDLPTLAGFWAGRDLEVRRAAGLLPNQGWYGKQKAQRRQDKERLLDALIRGGFLPKDFPREAAGWEELTGELHNAVIGALASTPSLLFLLNQEDLTKETEQQNLPGTTWEYPNWKRKMRLTLEGLRGPEAEGFVRMFRAWLGRTGRLMTGR
jgi:4-alpha-glucanotransferase